MSVLAVAPDAAPAVAPWDGPGAVRARLEDEAATVVALLERFGALLAVALDAAGRGDDDGLDTAVAERAWVMDELEPLLVSLAAARRQSRRHVRVQVRSSGIGDATAGSRRRPCALPPAVDAATLARILGPVDEALRHARLLHDRLTDEVGRRAMLALVR